MSLDRDSSLLLMRFVDGEVHGEERARVEALLEHSAEARALVAGLRHVGDQVCALTEQRAVQAQADDLAELVMARIEHETHQGAPVVALHAGRRAHWGRGSRRRLVAVAMTGLAVAAGIAMALWRVTGPSVQSLALVPSATHAPAVPTPSSHPEEAIASTVPGADTDSELGVSVDAVDFGAHTGTIFYVPTDTGTTTVVWLSDDDSGGSQP